MHTYVLHAMTLDVLLIGWLTELLLAAAVILAVWLSLHPTEGAR